MKFALLGHPLSHSISPRVHRLLSAYTGENITYELLDTPPEELPAVAARLLSEYDGFNVTVPYKSEIIRFLGEVEPSALDIGAVNTVVSRTSCGYNTDVLGFLAPMGETLKRASSVALVGAGGVGRMFLHELLRLKKQVTLLVRKSSLERGRAMAAEFILRHPGGKVQVTLTDEAQRQNYFYDLLINATPVGMHPNVNDSPVSEELVSLCGFVMDSIYNPSETKLLGYAKKHGIPHLNGLPMLVWQAAAAEELWLNKKLSEAEVNAVISGLGAL